MQSKQWVSSDEETSSPSTCILCEDRSQTYISKWVGPDKSDVTSKIDLSRKSEYFKAPASSLSITKTVDLNGKESKDMESLSRKSTVTSKKDGKSCINEKSKTLLECQFNDLWSDSDETDETNRLIQLRSTDYRDIVEEHLKIVVALTDYPKSKMRLKQMEQFQRSLADIVDMQLKAGLLKKVPTFLDYYLNRGAIICICKDLNTRDWMLRISAGLQERMCNNLVLLNSKVKRLCLARLKIPQFCWPATAKDIFKLLQYFNPTLKTDLWRIYAQNVKNDVEYTTFLIDRVSGEIIRGPTFKNIIDYSNMDFELTGYTEIYFDCFLTDLQDNLSSVASRVKLLEELRSNENTPRIVSNETVKDVKDKISNFEEKKEFTVEILSKKKNSPRNVKKNNGNSPKQQVLNRLKEVDYTNDNNETIEWSDDKNEYSEQGNAVGHDLTDEVTHTIDSESALEISDRTESIIESNDNLVDRNSTITIDSNRGIAYHRRTNYLHVENQLKVAITLEGYPQNKLEGTHIRRLKHLFKEYLHKDIKHKRFTNLIVPKFQDVYLSNGAVIYICDSLETKDYLTEVLPRFINSTGLKLMFRDIENLVRYTRVVMRIPKELAHLTSADILSKLRTEYPGLKPDCWKYYSDVIGRQKRQFGMDPESLSIIKSPDFDPIYEDEKLTFKIIDRNKRDNSFGKISTNDSITVSIDDIRFVNLRNKITKHMYCSIDSELMNAPLTKIRTNHYSDIVDDDLKLYVGPANYPETRVDELLFHAIKKNFESMVYDSVKYEFVDEIIPKIHDMYLFDGVIFIICQNMTSKKWIEKNISNINLRMHLNLKATEFRGAVGIVSMVIKTEKNTEEVISILQKQNPRLRTKYWREISVARSKINLETVLQIDKLSAQVITSPEFNKYIGSNPVQFKLGHLQSLIKPKTSLEKPKHKSINYSKNTQVHKVVNVDVGERKNKQVEYCQSINSKQELCKSLNVKYESKIEDNEEDPIIIDPESPITSDSDLTSPTMINHQDYCRMILKVPANILPADIDDFNIILDLLEDKNPGLNTELWKVGHSGNGVFTVLIDRQSASIIKSNNFDPTLGGEKLRFTF